MNKKIEHIQIRLPHNQKVAFTEYAKSLGMSVSEIIRILMAKELTK